jgi:nitroreductase
VTDIMTYILGRRSIRKFTPEPVSPEDILKLLQAGMAAPSASNRKPWEFVVVTDEAVLNKLRSGLVFGRYAAPLAISVLGNLKRAYPGFAQAFWIEDCSAATENILLAASGLGLGAVWIGVHPVAPFIKHVARTLNLPENVVPLNVILVGHPAETKEPRTQHEEQRVFWQEYEPRKMRKPKNEPKH